MGRPTIVVMRKNLAVSAACCLLLIFGALARVPVTQAATSSLPNDALLDKGYRQMYNLEFNSAHATFADYERANPTSAMGPVSDAAAYLFTELDRLNILRSDYLTKDESFFTVNKPAPADPDITKKFEDVLGRGQKLAAATLKQSP